MTNKNPYEKQGTTELDIPDFVEEKTYSDSESVDMSIFKMSDDELYDDTSGNTKVYSDDLEEDLEPKKKKKGSGSLVVCLIIIFLLLASLAGCAWYALREHRAYVKANTSYLQMMANESNYKKQIADQATTIETLNKQIEELKNAGSAKGEGSLAYEIIDGPIAFRSGNSRDADYVTYKGEDYAYNGDKYMVIEVVKDKDPDLDFEWAKVADNVYFCIGTSEESWAKKAD